MNKNVLTTGMVVGAIVATIASPINAQSIVENQIWLAQSERNNSPSSPKTDSQGCVYEKEAPGSGGRPTKLCRNPQFNGIRIDRCVGRPFGLGCNTESSAKAFCHLQGDEYTEKLNDGTASPPISQTISINDGKICSSGRCYPFTWIRCMNPNSVANNKPKKDRSSSNQPLPPKKENVAGNNPKKDPQSTSSPQNQKIDPEAFKVARGQLIFDSEGHECPDTKSKCPHSLHTRKPHLPPGKTSGVTIGRGYDLKRKPPQKIKEDLTAAGLRPEDAEQYANASGLQGEKAQQFIANNKDKLVEITPEQQKKLFEITYAEKAEYARDVTNRQFKGRVNWETLDPRIKEIVVDLAYRGDYRSGEREKIEKHIINNDFNGFKKVMTDPYWLHKKYPVPRDRFNRRNDYLN
jgi:hypothetical protein